MRDIKKELKAEKKELYKKLIKIINYIHEENGGAFGFKNLPNRHQQLLKEQNWGMQQYYDSLVLRIDDLS